MADFRININSPKDSSNPNSIPSVPRESSVQGQLVQIGSVSVLKGVADSFNNMVSALERDRGVVLNLEQGYLSEYEIVDELRKLVKFKTNVQYPELIPLLDPKKPMSDILKDADQYQKLRTYVDNLNAIDFEPPLKPNYTSASNVETVCFPNKTTIDPRRSGKLIKIGPIDLVKSPEIFKWLLNNSFLYGFVLYGDNALYYAGTDAMDRKIQQAAYPKQELRKLVGTFLESSDALSLFTYRL